jgi:nucleotide-binding universal stress UspA family protein
MRGGPLSRELGSCDMPLKTIFVGGSFDSTVESQPPANSFVRYAIDLAQSQNAHLSIVIGAFKLSAPSAILKGARDIIAAANEERRQQAETFAAELMALVRTAGLIGDIDVAHDHYPSVARRFVLTSRLADVAILQPNSEILSLQKGLIEEVLLASGRPVIVVPRGWEGSAGPERILVTWDGGAKAARAIGEGLLLLREAEEVEVVTASGDPDATKRLDGADIAPHLARHCRSVKVTQLPSANGDIAAALSNYAKLSRANLLVMGAYAHAKIMQIVFGGVTRSFIDEPPIPVFMSY